MENQPQTFGSWYNNNTKLFWVLVIVSFCIYQFIVDDDSTTKAASTTTSSPTATFAKSQDHPDQTQAYVIARNFVKASLKAPSTADFPWGATGYSNSGNEYNVWGQVDAQNSFGAMLRSEWYVSMVYDGGDWADPRNWTVKDIIIE